jgi:hypothetical protein
MTTGRPLIVPGPLFPFAPEFRSIPQASSIKVSALESIAQSRAYQEKMSYIPSEALAKVKELRNLSDRLRAKEESRIPTDVSSLERQQSELFNRLEDDLTKLGEIGEKMNIDVDPTTETRPSEAHERPTVGSSQVPRQGLQRFLRISRSFIKYNLTATFFLM